MRRRVKSLGEPYFEKENLVIIGKSGSGKSVLIKDIIRLLVPDSGELLVLGKSIPDLNQA